MHAQLSDRRTRTEPSDLLLDVTDPGFEFDQSSPTDD